MSDARRLKICGICRQEDANLAVELGAWALGFIFHEPSPRSVDVEVAAGICRAVSSRVLKVGVFVDRPMSVVQEFIDRCGLDVAQLHGSEAPEDAANLQVSKVWKAFRVREGFSRDDWGPFDGVAQPLLDTYRKGIPGGTGEVFDWSIARDVQSETSIILAGGIRPDNIARAFEEVNPFAVDASSGVEAEPGVKDEQKLRALFREAKVGSA
ncbi:MAG: phosphoribosylanthranilate isomerase [Planctomycetota bacterium]